MRTIARIGLIGALLGTVSEPTVSPVKPVKPKTTKRPRIASYDRSQARANAETLYRIGLTKPQPVKYMHRAARERYYAWL